MRGIKLLSISALAANKASMNNHAPTSRLDCGNSQAAAKTIEEPMSGRRKVLQALLGAGAASVVGPGASIALDMDAFANTELENDTKFCDPKRDPKCAPKMTSDEALCKYGQTGNARGEACKRFKATGGKMPASQQTKSLGGAYAM